MATTATSRRVLQIAAKHSRIQLQTRSLSLSPSSRLMKEGVHGSANPEKETPRDGPAYTAEGRRHKTDNEEQREKAVRNTPEEHVSPAQQHAQASKNKEGGDMNKIQTGSGPSTEAGKNLKTEK